MALSFANMTGRLAFGGLSDKLGRKLTFAIFGLSIPLTASLPTLTSMVDPSSSAPLVMFCGATVVIVSFYGAVFAVLPAYVADTFGQGLVGFFFFSCLAFSNSNYHSFLMSFFFSFVPFDHCFDVIPKDLLVQSLVAFLLAFRLLLSLDLLFWHTFVRVPQSLRLVSRACLSESKSLIASQPHRGTCCQS